MDNFKKIFLFVIATIVFLGLVFITFSSRSENSTFLENSKLDIKDGAFSLVKNGDIFEEKKWNSWSWLQWERFWIFNSLLFSSNASYLKNHSSENKTNIQLISWDFLVDVWDVTHEVVLNGTWFIAQTVWWGRVYVHTSPSKKTTFFSLDSVVKIQLIWVSDKKVKTEVYLYPHMLISFDAQRNNFLENADRIRVSTVHDFDYIYDSISKTDASYFISALTSLWFSSNFLVNTVLYQEMLLSESEKYISSLVSKKSKFKIPGDYYIQKYKMLFLNETKRKAYLKALIAEEFLTLIGSHGFEDSAYAQMNDYISQWEVLDKEEFQNFKNSLRPIVFYFLQSTDRRDIDTKKQLISLFSKTKNFDFRKNWIASTMLLSDIYRQFDILDDEKNYYEWIGIFIDSYSWDIGIKSDIEKNSKLTQKTYALDYLIFFLEKILVPDEENFSESNFPALIKIFDVYNTISYVVYWNGDESLAKTALYVNLNLIRRILNLLNVLYFQQKRDTKHLLVKKDSTSLSSLTINLLSKNISQIYSFFLDNKKFLSTEDGSKDMTLPVDYENINTLYKEYFSALLDYNTYLVEYDSVKKSLLDIDNLDNGQNGILSKEKLVQYFSQFSWFDFDKMEIVIGASFYEVNNVFINGQSFSFSFSPENSNEISNIKINGIDKNVSYKLDIVEQVWKKALETSQKSEADKYKFSNFFLLTFFGKKENQVIEVLDDVTPLQEEDSVVRVFKLNKLLSKKEWLWKNITHLQFKYDNISVILENQDPDIFLKNTLFQKTIVSNGYTWQLYADFSANFILDTRQNYFKDIKVKIYKNYLQDAKTFHFGNTPVQVIWNIDLDSASQKFDILWEALARIKYIEPLLSSWFNISNLDIKYFLWNDKIIIKFYSNGDTITLNITGDMVDSFNFSWKNILNNKIKYTEINNYIP